MPVKIFLSHAGPDTDTAKRIAAGLGRSGHDVTIDATYLHIGDNLIDFINTGIKESEYTVILLSRHTEDAKWQKAEQDAAIWDEIQNKASKCLVVRLDNCEIPPLLGSKRFFDAPNGIGDLHSYQNLINELSGAIRESHPKASEIVSKALAIDTDNPFRYTRAEYLENDPSALVHAFAPLDSLRMGKFHDIHPCFLEGPRGTGKSMLLLSIRARNLLQPPRIANDRSIFGFYLKLNPGPLCQTGFDIESTEAQVQGYIKASDIPAIKDISFQEVVLSLCESLVSELEYCFKESLLSVTADVQQQLCNAISLSLFIDDDHPSVHSFATLRTKLTNLHRRIARFIRYRFTYGKDPEVPVGDFDIQILVTVIEAVKRHIPDLEHAMFVALIDEYENLLPHQQRAVNTIIKFATPHFSVKIAKKIGVSDSPGTLIGSELQETHDYRRILLVYQVCNSRNRQEYRQFLSSIVEKQVQAAGLAYNGIDSLLPKSNDMQEGLSEQRILDELSEMERQRATANRGASKISQERTKNNHYREAAVYRAIAKVSNCEKHFSGFHKLSFLSSGIVRYFQEVLGVAYYLTSISSEHRPTPLCFPSALQSQAVHIVSDNAVSTLSKNVEVYGEVLKIMLIDLATCLRQKLLRHVSEPEAARVTIVDYESLVRAEYHLLRTVLDVGVREGVFQTREGRPAYFPKHGADPQGVEFNICRILAPSLKISPRLRWQTRLKAEVLKGLVDPDPSKRSASKSQLLKVVLNSKPGDGLSLQRALEFRSNEDQI